MATVKNTQEFDAWLLGLRDRQGKAAIVRRLLAAGLGNLGDCKSLGAGLYELRVHAGPGYRLYFCKAGGGTLVVLTAGKKDTQSTDIARARELQAREASNDSNAF